MAKNLTVYELYDRRSLADFLDFKDVNPDAPLVYVLQHEKNFIICISFYYLKLNNKVLLIILELSSNQL